MHTQSAENYLKCIYSLSVESEGGVSTNAIAERLETRASSVTDMLKKLGKAGWVNYRPYKATTLTTKGEKAAIQIIRKHRLWEVFLLEKLQFGWEEVHDMAEQLEHIQSDELVDRLDAFLGFPEADPHGDPIPDKTGAFRSTGAKQLLEESEINSPLIVAGVLDSSSEFLNYLDEHQIGIGTRVTLRKKFDFDRSVEIEVNGRTMQCSAFVSQNLFVKKGNE